MELTSAKSSPGRVGDTVRDVIAEVAPHELPLVDGLRQFDDEVAVRRLARGSKRREPLGFGIDELAVLMLTPIVWVAIDEVVRRAVGATADGVGRRLGRWLRQRKKVAGNAVPPLTREQIAEVHQRVLELAERNGIPPEQATALADRVVARLMMGPALDPPSPEKDQE